MGHRKKLGFIINGWIGMKIKKTFWAVLRSLETYAMRRFLILDTGNEKQEGSDKSEAPDEPLPKTDEDRLAELERRMEEQESRLANLETRLGKLEID